MLSPNAQKFHDLLTSMARERKTVFIQYGDIPRYIGADKCMAELVQANLVVKYSTAIGVRLQPIMPMQSEMTRKIVQSVCHSYGLPS